MKNITPKILKGFRDFLPTEARKRAYVANTFKKVFSSFGFEPLETPVLEYEEILTGKYGEEGDKLLYRFEDNGQRRVAMRYDQTVPLARVVAQYENQLTFPFKRYQIQPVWRAENTQKGRYREFVQCDIDTVGIDSALSDAEIVTTAINAYQKLGFKNFKILINDRKVFENLSIQAIIIIDKLKKIGEDGVCQELVTKNIVGSLAEAKIILQELLDRQPTERLVEIFKALEQLGIEQSVIEFSPTLARGLDYYTGMIFEIEIADYPVGSVCGGGRYNNLIGMFTDKQIPAVGLAVGFDRTIEAMEALRLFPTNIAESTTQVLVTVFSEELKQISLDATKKLRDQNINTEIYLGDFKAKNPLEKQLKYADAKNIPFLLIIGPQEAEKNNVTLRNMKTRDQQEGSLKEILQILH
ncbi:MAG TPA: histidine--tRNA ligase [Methylomirabilota bacterium]|nr:histidine--tRNA ligase [Methylomirabilota bacterium]